MRPVRIGRFQPGGRVGVQLLFGRHVLLGPWRGVIRDVRPVCGGQLLLSIRADIGMHVAVRGGAVFHGLGRGLIGDVRTV